jgi:hypothetical protein
MALSLDEQLQKAAYDLGEKVKQHQNEAIFCLREFEIAGEVTGDFIGPISDEFYHYEAGIIKGELQLADQKKQLLDIFTIPLFGMNHETHHLYGSHFVPVDRKISKTERYFQNALYFDIKELEKIKSGQIILDMHDFVRSNPMDLSLDRKESRLKKINLLAGNDEVKEFLKEKKIRNYNELFEILHNPSCAQERVDAHYNRERKNLADKLVKTMHEINEIDINAEEIEERVMKATFRREAEQHGSYLTWGEDTGVIENYRKLNNAFGNMQAEFGEILNEGEKIKLGTLKEIRADVIGFPAGVPPDEYILFAKGMISSAAKRMKNMNKHIAEEEKKAG